MNKVLSTVSTVRYMKVPEPRNLDRLELFELASTSAICEMAGPSYTVRVMIQVL
jgi:hypothetical protein